MIRITRPNPIIESLTHNLIQRCSAGGTPKGKAKLKTGQPLKRNKLSTKKGGGTKTPASAEGEEAAAKGKGRISEEKQKLYEQCLNAPCPIRSLTPKESLREAQREKLGLISKDKQRDLEIQKKGGGATPDEPIRIGTSGLDYVSLGIFDADELVKYRVTAEDGERLAKENSKVLMREHRERRAAESVLLGMKREAIEALPEKLRAAALEPDLTPFPANRGMATLTPPIEGYLEKVMDAAKKSSSKEKLR